MKKLAITKKLEAYVIAHPAAKAKDVAEKFGVAVAAVYAARNTVNKLPKVYEDLVETVAQVKVSPSPKREPVTMTSSPNMTLEFVKSNLSASEYKGFLKGNILVYSYNLCQGEPNGKDVADLIGLITALSATAV